MKVLQLCHKPSQPTVDGGCIAINNISLGLLEKSIDLKILTLSTHKHPFVKANFSEEFVQKTKIEGAFVDTKLNLVDAFSNLVTSDSYNVSRFFSTDFDIMLTKLLKRKKYDIIHLESLFMTPYIGTIRRLSKGKIVLRSHNLEYMIWERLASQTSNPAKKIYLKILAKQLKEYEFKIMGNLDGIAAISDEDQQKYVNIGANMPMITIPFGINCKNYSPKYMEWDPVRLKLFHVGSMDWKPNIEGISWFLEEIWPDINQLSENIELHLAGRNMPQWLINHESKNLINHGQVNSAIDFMRTYDMMVVPLLSAGGMRVKIIEGMALGKVVLTTRIGAEGINYKHRHNIIIADNKEEVVKELLWLNENPERFIEIGKNARKLVENYYDNDKITSALISFYEEVIAS